MCGIVGAISNRNVDGILMEGLRRLEYRGYDSAGLAVITKNNIETTIDIYTHIDSSSGHNSKSFSYVRPISDVMMTKRSANETNNKNGTVKKNMLISTV